jgi:hypothetical protein
MLIEAPLKKSLFVKKEIPKKHERNIAIKMFFLTAPKAVSAIFKSPKNSRIVPCPLFANL